MSTLSIKTAHSPSFKQRVKEYVGSAVATLSPRRTKQLFETPTSSPNAFRDKAIMAFLKRRATSQNQTEFFERLHLDFWKGEGGSAFSENCDHRFEDLFLAKQVPEFSALKQLWVEHQPDHIVEFGCNSGLLLDYLAKNLAGAMSWTGIEINEEQVRRNNDSESLDSGINFVCADGGKWLLENGKTNTHFVSNGGVLEYFRRERLDEMLSHIRENLKPAMFFASEPIADDHDWSETKNSIPFGEELSFSHNYTDLFESNGFEIVHQRAVEFDSWKMMATIAKLG